MLFVHDQLEKELASTLLGMCTGYVSLCVKLPLVDDCMYAIAVKQISCVCSRKWLVLKVHSLLIILASKTLASILLKP